MQIWLKMLILFSLVVFLSHYCSFIVIFSFVLALLKKNIDFLQLLTLSLLRYFVPLYFCLESSMKTLHWEYSKMRPRECVFKKQIVA